MHPGNHERMLRSICCDENIRTHGDDDTAEPAWDHLLCDRNREECCMASMPDAVELYGLFSSLSLLGLPSMRASTPTSADLGLTGLIPSPGLFLEGALPKFGVKTELAAADAPRLSVDVLVAGSEELNQHGEEMHSTAGGGTDHSPAK
eukprot:6180284-Pleurochrysis_carterae.AAC.2